MIVGIDGVNLRSGGAVRHVSELLRAADPADHAFDRVVLFASEALQAAVSPAPWLTVIGLRGSGSVLRRELWRFTSLGKLARSHGCTVLLSPGGNPVVGFRPFVSMSQNMLPFEDLPGLRPVRRSRLARVHALRLLQSYTFRRADGVLFLSQHAANRIVSVLSLSDSKTAVVPFGVSLDFAPNPAVRSEGGTFRWVYLSAIDYYKHQVEAVQACQMLLEAGRDIRLELVGNGPLEELAVVRKALQVASDRVRVFSVDSNSVARTLEGCDAALFLSACENLPNALIESVSAGLPVVMGSHGSFREVVGDAGIPVDESDPAAIAQAMEVLMDSYEDFHAQALLRSAQLRQRGWSDCARETFGFLSEVVTG